MSVNPIQEKTTIGQSVNQSIKLNWLNIGNEKLYPYYINIFI